MSTWHQIELAVWDIFDWIFHRYQILVPLNAGARLIIGLTDIIMASLVLIDPEWSLQLLSGKRLPYFFHPEYDN